MEARSGSSRRDTIGGEEEDATKGPKAEVVVSSSFYCEAAYSARRAFYRCLRSRARRFLRLLELEAGGCKRARVSSSIIGTSTMVISGGGMGSCARARGVG